MKNAVRLMMYSLIGLSLSITMDGCFTSQHAGTSPGRVPVERKTEASSDVGTRSASTKTKYNCLCAHCGYHWTSSSVPTACPKCMSGEVTYLEQR